MTKKNFAEITIYPNIPLILLEEVNRFSFPRKKSREHLMKLIAVLLYELEEDENLNPYSFYKELKTVYIIDYLTTKNFYNQHFIKYLQGHVGDMNYSNAIFQTDGKYWVGGRGKHYRINPKFLMGPKEERKIELEVECLNYLFPDVIEHFNYSASHINQAISREDMNKEIQRQAIRLGVEPTGATSVYQSTKHKIGDFATDEEKKMPKVIRIDSMDGKWMTPEEVDSIIEKKNTEVGEPFYRLVHERNKNDKSRFDIVCINEYLDSIYIEFKRRVDRKIDKAIKKKWNPIISSSNGRFNHLFTNLDNFCIDFFYMDNEPIVSYDLKCSQPTILANLLIGNPIFKESILNSKYGNLIEMLCKNDAVFFKGEDNGWLDRFLDCDIYKTVASENMDRTKAKKKMMVLLFTEPKATSILKKPLIRHFPEFGNGLQSVKEKFHQSYGTSKSTLPTFLQMVEAHIFIEIIYQEVAKARIPAITKHDSILCPASRLPEIESIVKECFERIGFRGRMVLDVKKESIVNVFPDWFLGANSLEELNRSYHASH